MLNHVLVPLDGSELAEKALDYARSVTAPDGVISLLSVVDVPEYPANIYYPAGLPTLTTTSIDLQKDIIPQANDYLNKVAEQLIAQGFRVQKDVQVGEPASAIVEYASQKNVDAIVMSTHGRSGLGRWLFGSVANKVLSSSTVPIFIIPAKSK
jgi:nucleotide-binding universal stress UspA family protein